VDALRGTGLPFRAERIAEDEYGFRGFQHRFPNSGQITAPIKTAENLLHCMKGWSNAPTKDIVEFVREAGGQLIIMNKMLAVEVDDENIPGLNEKLISLKNLGGRMETELGLPENIDPYFNPKKREKLWQKLYGRK
jgi:hypothetical protein